MDGDQFNILGPVRDNVTKGPNVPQRIGNRYGNSEAQKLSTVM